MKKDSASSKYMAYDNIISKREIKYTHPPIYDDYSFKEISFLRLAPLKLQHFDCIVKQIRRGFNPKTHTLHAYSYGVYPIGLRTIHIMMQI